MDTANPARPVLNPVIDEFYSARYDEADRLSRDAPGRLERDRTREILRRVLPAAPARILDIGGGPGVYAAWLAELGYQVTMIEPVARHREQAAAYGTFAVADGDARALAHPDASADAVLLLGPMYHLVDPAERALALAEAGRVVRPGGVIAAAFINRQAPILDVSARLRINDDGVFAHLRRLRDTGVNDEATGFTVAYFHSPREILADFAAAGLPEPRLVGIEGPLMALIVSGLVEDRPDYFEAALRSAQVAEDHPDLLATSAHVLAVVGSAPHGAPGSA
ncbi:class I SAM-dependent methyltransferase [Actinospica robiniae]|uniref:class I SAM-dependent methyltransferase n=1 Tax=Actinospica robiniae TaxID=304901 RepID=UPI00040AC8C0|nr:class I SAM-dependent methyltransferase [Actinospica robiniae]